MSKARTTVTPVIWHGLKGDGLNRFEMAAGTALLLDDQNKEHKPIQISKDEAKHYHYIGIMCWIHGHTYVVFSKKDRKEEVAQPWSGANAPSVAIKVAVQAKPAPVKPQVSQPSPNPTRTKTGRVKARTLDTSFLD